MKYSISEIEKIIFTNKQNIPWSDVEQYLKRYIGQVFVVKMYQDKIHIAGDFPNEFSESKYTKRLRGALAKVKANAAQGWYRYDTYFRMPVKGSEETEERFNECRATLIVRKTSNKLYLYDVLDIKKEASTPLES
ncbi:MAG: hypothetical protein NC118_12860 [Eubacterium sp.]|nr:hypothetical protein [Eubacterium sp.]